MRQNCLPVLVLWTICLPDIRIFLFCHFFRICEFYIGKCLYRTAKWLKNYKGKIFETCSSARKTSYMILLQVTKARLPSPYRFY